MDHDRRARQHPSRPAKLLTTQQLHRIYSSDKYSSGRDNEVTSLALAEPTSLVPAIRALSTLVSRSQLANRAGYQFGTTRDLYATLGYKRELTYADFESRYRRGGLAKRLVDFYPKRLWSAKTIVRDDADPKRSTPFETEFGKLSKRLRLWSVMQQADVLASIGRYSVVVIGAEGRLNEVLSSVGSAESVSYLRAYAEDEASINRYVSGQDRSSDPRFGEPEEYSVNFGSNDTGNLNTLVHWSRVLHYVREPFKSRVKGLPSLEAIWNDLDNLDKLLGGGSEAFWANMERIVAWVLNEGIDLDDDEKTDFQTQIDEIRHGLKNHVRLRGVEPKTIDLDVADFSKPAETLIKVIAGTSGIPHRALIGNESGLRSSETDDETVNDRVTEDRENFAEPAVRELIDRFISIGALPEPVDGEYEVVWPEQDELSEPAKGKLAVQLATANRAQQQAEGKVLLSADEVRERLYDMGPGEDSGVDDTDTDDTDADADTDTDDGNLSVNRSIFLTLADTTDREATEPEWKVVHRVADEHRDAIADLVTDAWASVQQSIVISKLEESLSGGNLLLAQQAVFSELDVAEADLRDAMFSRLLTIVNDGGLAALRSVRARGSFFRANAIGKVSVFADNGKLRNAQFTASFDVSNPRASQWARLRSSQLIRQISETTRAAVRGIIAGGFIDGTGVRKLANRVRAIVGLRWSSNPGSNQILQLQRYIDEQSQLGLTDEQLARRINRRATQLRRQRAILIARTETITAANYGQKELWLQAIDRGQLNVDQARVWIVTPDERNIDCPVCPPMDGQVRAMNELFETGDGRFIDLPTAHPDCRCSVGLATERDLERAGLN